MNQRGRDALRAAALAGVPQIFGQFHDDHGGHCGLGVLDATRSGLCAWQDTLRYFDLRGRTGCLLCPFEFRVQEDELIAHYNDTHHLDFFKIADLMPVTDDLP